jgi:bacillithiol system protein YtxJ
MAKLRLEAKWDSTIANEVVPYYLDLLTYRSISNEIAERFQVHHESPQILLIKDGECIYDASHLDITIDEIMESINYHA